MSIPLMYFSFPLELSLSDPLPKGNKAKLCLDYIQHIGYGEKWYIILYNMIVVIWNVFMVSKKLWNVSNW